MKEKKPSKIKGKENAKAVAKPEDAARISDTTLPMKERKAEYQRILNAQMNPKETFDPETFDPMEDDADYEVKRRPRKEPPRRLPTKGLKPKEIIDGQMIGMFESKQDLYLLIAWLSERVSTLEEQLQGSNPHTPQEKRSGK